MQSGWYVATLSFESGLNLCEGGAGMVYHFIEDVCVFATEDAQEARRLAMEEGAESEAFRNALVQKGMRAFEDVNPSLALPEEFWDLPGVHPDLAYKYQYCRFQGFRDPVAIASCRDLGVSAISTHHWVETVDILLPEATASDPTSTLYLAVQDFNRRHEGAYCAISRLVMITAETSEEANRLAISDAFRYGCEEPGLEFERVSDIRNVPSGWEEMQLASIDLVVPGNLEAHYRNDLGRAEAV